MPMPGGQNLDRLCTVCRTILSQLGPPQLPYGVKSDFVILVNYYIETDIVARPAISISSGHLGT